MRRLFLLPLLLMFALALSACGGNASPANGGETGGDGPVVISAAVGDPLPADASAPPQPTALPTLGLTIENVQYEALGNGNVNFTAQVINAGTEQAQPTKVVIDLYDATGVRITRMSFSSPGLPALKPGEGASWQGQRGGLNVEWAEVRASVVAEPVAAAR